MTHNKKLALGLATALPLLYLASILVCLPVVALNSLDGTTPLAGLLPTLIPVHLLAVLVTVGLVPTYVWLVLKNPRLTHSSQQLWIVMIVVGGLLAMPVYFWQHVRSGLKDRPRAATD